MTDPEPESDLARRVREQLNDSFDWSATSLARRWATPKVKNNGLSVLSLPLQRAPKPAGVVKGLTPSKHEQSILRRAARGFIVVTMTEGGSRYFYEDGSPVRAANGNPIERDDFARLKKFLVPDRGDTLLSDAPAQRWNVRKP
jgi:hypothetical protein